MTRIIFLTLFSVIWAFAMNAQITVRNRPYWIEDTPIATKDAGFYYFVTSAEGTTVEEAYNKAYSMAVLAYSSRIGVSVTASLDSTMNVSVEERQMRVRINQACLYSEDVLEANRLRVFVLWQIAKSYNVNPDFEIFNYCYKPNKNKKRK